MGSINKVLPPAIIQQILCFMPIQEAGRTCIISKDWKHHWTKIPIVAFDEETYHVASDPVLEQAFDNPSEMRRRFFSAISQVFLKREAPIVEFSLTIDAGYDETCVEVDDVLSFLSKSNTLQRLTLHLNESGYRLPSSLFLLDRLTDMRFAGCHLHCQPEWNGFRHLTDLLFMSDGSTTTRALQHLLCKCPSLKRVCLNFFKVDTDDNSTVINLFECFAFLESLSIYLSTVTAFATAGVPHMLPAQMIYLKYACIGLMSFTDNCGLPFILFLIRNSPNLEKLEIQVNDEESTSFKKSADLPFIVEDNQDIWLARLEVLHVDNWTNIEKGELALVKLILAKSPNLKKVKIDLRMVDLRVDDQLKILTTLLKARRASPMAEIDVRRM